jgi:hypothetical protein
MSSAEPPAAAVAAAVAAARTVPSLEIDAPLAPARAVQDHAPLAHENSDSSSSSSSSSEGDDGDDDDEELEDDDDEQLEDDDDEELEDEDDEEDLSDDGGDERKRRSPSTTSAQRKKTKEKKAKKHKKERKHDSASERSAASSSEESSTSGSSTSGSGDERDPEGPAPVASSKKASVARLAAQQKRSAKDDELLTPPADVQYCLRLFMDRMMLLERAKVDPSCLTYRVPVKPTKKGEEDDDDSSSSSDGSSSSGSESGSEDGTKAKGGKAPVETMMVTITPYELEEDIAKLKQELRAFFDEHPGYRHRFRHGLMGTMRLTVDQKPKLVKADEAFCIKNAERILRENLPKELRHKAVELALEIARATFQTQRQTNTAKLAYFKGRGKNVGDIRQMAIGSVPMPFGAAIGPSLTDVVKSYMTQTPAPPVRKRAAPKAKKQK